MFVQQFFVNGLAHSSYLLGGTNTCAVIDPRRDVDIYLEAAKAMEMKITHILLTHLHADFVSGFMDLADKTGAVIYAPEAGKCEFKHKALSEGSTFEIEDLAVKVLDTPGHTPEHITYVVTDRSRSEDPVAIFCGDVLFVGDVGRPDLFPGIAEKLASNLYDSLHKIVALPDYCEVYPAHGAGSLCGRAIGAKRTSTVGYERRNNYALQLKDRDMFIKSLITNMPAAPDHFSRSSAINRKGPELVRKLPVPAPLEPKDFWEAAQREDTLVLDVRSYEAFGAQHVPGSWNIMFSAVFSTFAGWILPPDKDILLVAPSKEQAQETLAALRRVGLDRVKGVLSGGMFAWAKEGLPIDHICLISGGELNEICKSARDTVILDVRSKDEFGAGHIDGAVNIPAPELRTRHTELDKDSPIAVVCTTGIRSGIACSILKTKGFKKVYNVTGGMTGYNAAGYSAECPACAAPHLPAKI
ncbi:MBL fold metallo-hydrolase [Pelotomaculum propionicicum]|uniref:MBL fold metallo-hydrolase n=1 Tax=Pelotomaculum propionicicum TaxID=258475 RepID=UPI003B7D9667